MSATAARNKNQIQPAPVRTTGRGAALRVTLGMGMLTLGMAFSLVEELTVHEKIRFYATLYGIGRDSAAAREAQILASLELGPDAFCGSLAVSSFSSSFGV